MKKVLIGLLLAGSLYAESIYATFDVEASRVANVAFSSGGIIDKIYVDVGSLVKKGDSLAVLQNKDVKAMLNIHKTNLKFAKKDYDRQVKIKNIIDQAKFDKYANAFESANAQVQYQEALLEKTILKAPFDAIVVSKEL
ncbi:MAG: biotin/lipoyl-binding protein, partial [Campylobacterota bacterium]|nr:biotin/lipoyl-binding protein [Campylobacterota bacterium]